MFWKQATSSEGGSPVRAQGGWVQPFKDNALPLLGVPVPAQLGGPGPLYAQRSDPEPSYPRLGSSVPGQAQLGSPAPSQAQLSGPAPSHAHPQLWSTQSLPLSPDSRSLSSIRQAQTDYYFTFAFRKYVNSSTFHPRTSAIPLKSHWNILQLQKAFHKNCRRK
jgi:hypothetical protein